MTSSNTSPPHNAHPCTILGIQDIIRTFSLAKTSNACAQIIVSGTHFAFWKPQVLHAMIQKSIQQTSWPHYTLFIQTQQNQGHAHLAITSSLTLSVIHETPIPPSLTKLAKRHNTPILSLMPS